MHDTKVHDAAQAAHNRIAAQEAQDQRSERITRRTLAVTLTFGIIAAVLAYVLFPDYWMSFRQAVDPGTASGAGQLVGILLIGLVLFGIAAILPAIVLALSKIFPLGRSGR